MEQTAGTGGQKAQNAPYTSYQTVKTMAKQMKEHGVPSRIDRSVLTNFSGAVGSQLMTALKFMKLTDAEGRPTDQLRDLVDAYDTENWSAKVEGIVRSAYSPMFQIDLETATPAQFTEQFRSAYAGTDDVARKSITFFLNAARDGGIKISQYILKNKKPRTNGATKRRAAKSNTGTPKRNETAPDPTNADNRTPAAMLYEILNPSKMNDDEMNAVFTLMSYLKRTEAED